MKNLKIVICLSVILFTATLTQAWAGATSHFKTDDKRQVESYHGLGLNGAFDVTLIQGEEESVTISASSEVAAQIFTKVKDGTLEIYTEDDFKTNEKIAITVNFKNLDAIDCSGAIVLNGSVAMKFKKLSLDASGACKATLELSAESLDVDISGASTFTLKGNVPKVSLDISGAGKFFASDMTSDDYDIDISGTGNAEVNAAKTLDVEVSGTGKVKYSGEPKVTKEISGVGMVSKMN